MKIKLLILFVTGFITALIVGPPAVSFAEGLYQKERFDWLIVKKLTVLAGGANIQSAMDFDSTLNVDGATTLNSTLDVDGNLTSGTGAFTVADNTLIDGAADAVQLTVQGFTTNTNNVFVVEQSDGTNVLEVDVDGQLTNDNSAITITDNVFIDGQADLVQFTVQANGTQTSNVFEMENSAGTAKATIDNAGKAIFAGGMELSGGPLIVDRQNETVTATFIITPTSSNIVMTSDAAYTSSTTTPVITTTATDGQIIYLRNGNASDVLIVDGTGGTVECKANVSLGTKDIMTLMYDATDAVWYCQSVQDNS